MKNRHSPATRTTVFISYSRKDSRYLTELKIHLKPLEWYAEVAWWDDTRIEAGNNWRSEIREAIASAKIAVLLISQHFLASEFIAEDELPPLLEAAEQDSAVILPVILRPCLFERIEELARYQAINSPSAPLVDLNEGERDKIWVKLAGRILDILGDGKLSLSKARRTASIRLKQNIQTTPPRGTPIRTERRAGQSRTVPDLEILVSTGVDGSNTTLSYNLKASNPELGINYQLFGPIVLRHEPMALFGNLLEEVQGMAKHKEGKSRRIALRRLGALSSDLVEKLFPFELIELLGSLEGKIKTLMIISDETWIPWEMLQLRTRSGQAFLGEIFSVCRWLSGVEQTLQFAMRRVAMVAPGDGSQLPSLEDEATSILSSFPSDREISKVPAEYLALTDALASARYDAWHIIAHSVSSARHPDGAKIILDNRELLRPVDLSSLTFQFGKENPLFFLSGPTLHGWAARLLHGGAGAVITSYWITTASAAVTFSTSFYNSFFSGLPIGAAVQKARHMARDKNPGDLSWLAFTAFANPGAVASEQDTEADDNTA